MTHESQFPTEPGHEGNSAEEEPKWNPSESQDYPVSCPNCGKEMEEGTLHTRNYPFWTQQELRFFRAPTDTVELGPIGDDTTLSLIHI